MTASNRVRIASVREVTIGVTPGSPRMRAARYTGESLKYVPTYLDSEEIRSDRMMGDATPSLASASGGVDGEFIYPVANSPFALDIASAFSSDWVDTVTRDNDGTADSVITNVANTTDVVTVTTGAAFAIGHMVRFSGFTAPANNGTFRCTTGSATVPAFLGAGFVLEATPPATARMKVVGAQGASGDITATASGLGSTTLNFTTLGLQVGQWVKIGGTAVGTRFNTAANRGFARITAITATALTLDNLPLGWSVDAGTGKTISIWFGDVIKNGTTVISQSIEKGFLGQQTPNYIVYNGMTVNTFGVNMASSQKITYQVAYMGLGSPPPSATPLDASVDPATTNGFMAANSNVGRIADAGATISGLNRCREFSFEINNNLRTIEDVASIAPVDIAQGEFGVTGRINTYFGDTTLYAKFQAGTPTSINSVVTKDNQAVVIDVPRAIYREGGEVNATAKNTDVMLSLNYQASVDTLTNAHALMNRFEYFEA